MQEFEIEKGKLTNYRGNDKKLKIPDSVTHMESRLTMQNNIVEEIHISASVQFIGIGAFFGFPNLKYIHVAKDNPYYTSQDGLLFNKDKTCLLFYPPAKQEQEYTIPDSIRKIEQWAFMEAEYLKKITLHEKIETISYLNFTSCKNLSCIHVSEKNPYYADIDGVLFDKKIQNLMAYPCNKKDEKYIIPDKVKTVCSYAFASPFLKEIVFPETLQEIESFIFLSNHIEIINIPKDIKHISSKAFHRWNHIKIIKMQENNSPQNNPAYENIHFDAFSKMPEQIQVYEKDSLKYIIAFDMNFSHPVSEMMNLIHSKVTNRYEKIWELLSSREMRFSFILSRMLYDKNISQEDSQNYQEYISKNGKFILKYVIEQKNIEYLKLCRKYHAVKKSNILWAIDYAQKNENYEMQILLMNYKHEKGL